MEAHPFRFVHCRISRSIAARSNGLSILLLWALAFNLLQLFIYRRLGRSRRPKDPTDTIRHIVEVMLRELAVLPAPPLGPRSC